MGAGGLFGRRRAESAPCADCAVGAKQYAESGGLLWGGLSMKRRRERPTKIGSLQRTARRQFGRLVIYFCATVYRAIIG